MTRRSATNDRYNDSIEKKKTGTSRKSAASAKPSREAAGSVYVVSKKKTKAELKEEQRKKDIEERRIEQLMEEKTGANPKTQKMRYLRVAWWVTLALAIACTILAWFARNFMPEWASYVVMVLAYIFIVAALVIDLVFIRKERNKAKAAAESTVKGGRSKLYSEAKKQVRAEMREEARAEKAKEKDGGEEPKKKSGLAAFGNLLTGKK